MMLTKINIDTWNRKEIYRFYKNFDIPRYQITVNVDVYKFYQYVKKQELSFYFSFMWLVLDALNDIPNFKYRLIKDEVFLCDVVHPSFTDVVEDSDLFKIVNANFDKDIMKFNKLAKEKSKLQGKRFIDYNDEVRQDLVYVTTFPWAKFTQATNPTNFDSKDAIPRIGWGKFDKKDEKWEMPITIEAHHACADGYHVGLLINKIEQRLKSY
jgi:chloramphenicol O-acetyltransferase type A